MSDGNLNFTDLGSYKHIDYLESDTLEGLKDQIQQIKFPSSIKAIYFDGKKHVAWLHLSKKINKRSK